MTDEGRLHIAFGHSAAGSLKMALATMGIDEPVASLVDDYSMGPINPGNANQRAEWEREELGEDEPISNSGDVSAFWGTVSAWPGQLVAWMSSRAAVELCGLHELLWRLPEARLQIVDVANVEFRADNAPKYDERRAFAIVRDDRIVEHSLIDFARAISDVERASSRRTWSQLRTENAPLRVLTDAGLVSGPVTYFDDRIRAEITSDWQRCARVVGAMMGAVSRGTVQEFHSDTFFFVRLLRLIDEDSDIEGRNDDGPDEVWSMRSSWVRRRPRA